MTVYKKYTVVVLGDSKSGKSTLLTRLCQGRYLQEYSPTSFDRFSTQLNTRNGPIQFNFWDTAGSSSYDSIRPLTFEEADVFLLCYSNVRPTSLDNIKNKWIREIRTHRESAPIVLCGCQSDLRDHYKALLGSNQKPHQLVNKQQVLAISLEIGARYSLEVSAFTSRDVTQVLEKCALAVEKGVLSEGFGCKMKRPRKVLKALSKTEQEKSKKITVPISQETAIPECTNSHFEVATEIKKLQRPTQLFVGDCYATSKCKIFAASQNPRSGFNTPSSSIFSLDSNLKSPQSEKDEWSPKAHIRPNRLTRRTSQWTRARTALPVSIPVSPLDSGGSSFSQSPPPPILNNEAESLGLYQVCQSPSSSASFSTLSIDKSRSSNGGSNEHSIWSQVNFRSKPLSRNEYAMSSPTALSTKCSIM